jgi:hypothetical protein
MATILTILQSWIVSDFILPLLLIFFIVFAILEKTKLFGDGKKQLNALTSIVISLIFVGAVYPKIVVENLVLFFVVAIVAIFIILLLWGFVFGDEKGFKPEGWMKWILGIGLLIAFAFALIWATDWWGNIFSFFRSSLGQTITTNAIFILIIVIALAAVLAGKSKPSS